ncbi:hypothetical protein EOM39_07285, partial [Candidatus Gracilibacteria bacterium]|nr:hypothetical protein [Candidatus Gracilibacteria bacterium]
MVVLKRPRINKPIPQDTPTQDVSGVVNKPISQPTKQDYSDILAGKKTEPASFDTKLEDWKKTYIPEATGPGQVTPTQISPDIAKIPIDNSVSGIYKTTIGNKLEDINQAKITASKNIAENIYKGAFKGGEMFNQATEKARTGDLKGAYADLGKAWIKEGSTVAEGIFSPISVGLSKEVTSEFGPTGETISEIAPLPFKALHKINYDLSKQYLGLDDETANNYSTVISTLFLLGIGTKGKDPGMEIQKSFDLVKGGKATIESEKIYSQLIRQVHPDYFQKADPVYKQKIENIASELNVLRESGDIAGMQKIIDQNKGIIEEARKSQKQNIMKGGYIDLGVILGKDKNKIELAKNEDLTKIVEILNDGAKNFNPEILGAGLIELRDLNIDQESKDKIIEETARMKSIIESYKESISTPGKEKSLIGKYGEDLYNKARNVILNDKGQDRFTDIEGNKKPNKINKDGSKGDDLEKLYLAIEEYKTQNNIDNGVTSQDLYEELKSAINKKSLVRPTKKSVLGELDNTGNLNIENI